MAFYNTYDLTNPDRYGLYDPTSTSTRNFTPVASGTCAGNATNTYNMLLKAPQDLTSRKSTKSEGRLLRSISSWANSPNATVTLQPIPITYTAAGDGAGIAIAHGTLGYLLMSTRAGTFILQAITPYGINSVGTGYYENDTSRQQSTVSYCIRVSVKTSTGSKRFL